MKRWVIGLLALCVMLPAPAAFAAGRAAADREARETLGGASCSLEEAVELALEEVPGTAVRARLKRGKRPDGVRVWFFKVVIFDDGLERHVRRYAARSCEPITPPAPAVGLLEAVGTAKGVVDGSHALGARLRYPGLHPIYDVVILTPRHKRLLVRIDGESGLVLLVRRWHPRHDRLLDEDDDGETR